jgi:hypothetical protein
MRFALVVVLAACSCSSPEEPPRADVDVPAVAAEPPSRASSPATAAKMNEHMRDAGRIKEAVIAGDLDDARSAARRLSEQLAADELPEAQRPRVREAVRLAEVALDTDDLAVAASAVAGLGLVCGECHAAVAGGPKGLTIGAAPAPAERDPKAQMTRHQWAADHMWLALVARTDGAWRTAAEALASAPLDIEAITADVELTEDVLRLPDRVHELGRRAGATGSWDERATIYGEVLASCAACHRGGC